ncbi:MAG: hypothetical protein O7F73_20440 [Gammaproteobacteria bacterium]|nr:hypothetical protein [Gammaproteobacteria bacterium]
MGTTGKVVAGLSVAALVVVVLVVTLAVKNLDDIIRQAIESAGTQATQTKVSLDSAAFTLQDGRGELHGLSIANPPGYTTKNAFQMEQIALQVDLGSLAGDVIVVKEVLVDGALLVAEQKGLTTNLKELLENIEQSAGGDKPATAPPSEAADVRLMVEKFSFINSSATVVTQQWGEKTLPIPNIVMTDIGDKKTGLTPEQLASTMSQTLMRRAERAVTDYLEKLAKDAAKKELVKQLESKLSDDDQAILKGLKSMFDE